AFRPEHIDDAGEGIDPHRLAHQRRQPLGSLAEVDRLRRHHHPDVAGRSDHELALSAWITAAIARGLASAPTRTATPPISSSIPFAADRRRARRGGVTTVIGSGCAVSTTAGTNIAAAFDTGSTRASRRQANSCCGVSPWWRATAQTVSPSP